ncbi:TIGR02594 family protein [Bradyrhizobium barranii subsp. barranii]|uniref:TIGR02594 family protein n=1 Tax=Bradyrhizobium barranii subsp. barranii TaxID=2823807 RepID=A0A939M9A8_9BRAD|nr:TIGR02594 family protein [Bradyrhizobium barranii]UEM08596.1 TIGR02594 family protein [Bradyrhizobium barranii subsp. barranii]
MSLAPLVAAGPLRFGASGDAVRQIQLALKQIGYSLTGTGWFGPATDTAVETFQKRAGLVVDGEIGPKTAAALDLAVAGKAPVVAPAQEIGRPLWLEAGIKLIGTKEGGGAKDNPTIIQWAKDEGGDIAAEYTHDSIPWCALFANHCLTKVGLKGTGTLWALDFAGHWPSVELAGPTVGAFAPMKRTGGGHIMQIVGRDQHGNIMGLGGNQSDAVNIEPFAVSRLNKGFWWPGSVPVPPASQIGIGHLPFVQSNGKVSVNEA